MARTNAFQRLLDDFEADLDAAIQESFDDLRDQPKLRKLLRRESPFALAE